MSAAIKTEPRTKHIALWVMQILLALAFLGAGFAKVSGQPMMVETFAKIGLGQWFRYFTGGIEIISAIFLLIPTLVPVGALLLVVTMVGAALAHLLVLGGAPIPPIILLILSGIVAWGRTEQLKQLLGYQAK
jgi:putative oxidoreductase